MPSAMGRAMEDVGTYPFWEKWLVWAVACKDATEATHSLRANGWAPRSRILDSASSFKPSC